MIIDTSKIWDAVKFPVCTFLIFAIIVIAGIVVYNCGRGDAVSTQPSPQQVVQPQATPIPTPSLPQYPHTVTVTAYTVSGMPYNGFPELIDTSGKIYDLSGAVGPDIGGIDPGATYQLYLTGQYIPSYNTAETIYRVQWISLISEPANYRMYTDSYYVYEDGGGYWLYENDGYYHRVREPDAVRGHQIVRGTPRKNTIRF